MAGRYSWEEGEVLGDDHRINHNTLGYIISGTGSPEGVETAPVGSLFIRTDGGAGTSFYMKESGTGNTGWVSSGSISTPLSLTGTASPLVTFTTDLSVDGAGEVGLLITQDRNNSGGFWDPLQMKYQRDGTEYTFGLRHAGSVAYFGTLTSGMTLTLLSDAGETNASLTPEGQFQIPTVGSSGGLLLGGDVLLYRGAADVLMTADGLEAAMGFRAIGDYTPASGSGLEMNFNGVTSYITSYNRTAGSHLAMNLRASQIDLSPSGTTRARVTGSVVDLGDATSLVWGTAIGTNDVNLYRSAADVLKTDDTFQVGGGAIFSGIISPPQITSDQNNYNPTGLETAVIVRLDVDNATRTITGLAGGTAGRVIWLASTETSNIITLAGESLSSTAANRFATDNSVDITLRPNCMVGLVYDGTSSRWRVFSYVVNVSNSTPADVSTAGSAGTQTTVSRRDHVHAHGSVGTIADAHNAADISIADAGGDFTATDVEGALDELQADNEAHVAAADPHTGYRLESADHTHQSTGAQAGQLDHGLALTGLTDDDHTQYLKEAEWTAKGDLMAASAASTVARIAVGTNGQRLTPKSGDAAGVAWEDDTFTVGGVLLDPSGARTVEVWRAPFACEITAYHARVVGGTNAVTNAQVDASDILTGDLTTTPADGWEAGTIVSSGVEDVTAGEVIKLEVVSISGAVTEISWAITLRRAA